MSIKGDVMELESIRFELKGLTDKRKKLKEKEKAVEVRISEYLKSKDQPGLKHHGTAIILEEKDQQAPKKAKDRDVDAMSVLEKYGVKDTEKVLKEIMQARKGETIVKEKLKIKKYKDR
jgi:glutamine synthetase adenylyltransferase